MEGEQSFRWETKCVMESSNSNHQRVARIRYPSDLVGSCRAIYLDGELYWPAQVRAISFGGALLLLDRRFDTGTVLSLELDNPTETFAIKVSWAVTKGEKWLVACRRLDGTSEEVAPR